MSDIKRSSKFIQFHKVNWQVVPITYNSFTEIGRPGRGTTKCL